MTKDLIEYYQLDEKKKNQIHAPLLRLKLKRTSLDHLLLEISAISQGRRNQFKREGKHADFNDADLLSTRSFCEKFSNDFNLSMLTSDDIDTYLNTPHHVNKRRGSSKVIKFFSKLSKYICQGSYGFAIKYT